MSVTHNVDPRQLDAKESGIRVLILGEEYDPVDGLRLTLTKSGYAVQTAQCEHEDLPKLLLWNPDAILLDLSNTRLDAVEFFSRLRALSPAQIIVFSAASDSSILVDTLDAGADDFVWKPLSLRAVQARLGACLRRQPHRLLAIRSSMA
ncbi:two-component system, OmpR family, KDP operon response regulator KdpE/two-component system, OmpR family, response regulator MtrA [Granulicella rosea]|uniref:Two-component system, OmpR family, KDP operon response regulator KdpE/two-component system, OmpR family, response regulator MtrA n=2 Tax=Granulicella rosea TaxID=474952 RepID=A0A239EFT5_9BACT|nr:response regulator [Granulicella rosea]SNS42762.1 two-component system, OmpR family, KDP operon response regulator KdpE/two-component system, OmpR family, response regulator MtrA [Granulicella rosea]